METLLADDSFCGEGGRFGSPLCDWFVIGGRWSGMLKKALLGDAYKAAFRQEFPDMAGDWYSSTLVEKHRDRLNQFWQRFGGIGAHPCTRSTYNDLGCEDDATLVDEALYDHFLKPYAGQAFAGDTEFADLDGESVEPSFIGRKWLALVDYHN